MGEERRKAERGTRRRRRATTTTATKYCVRAENTALGTRVSGAAGFRMSRSARRLYANSTQIPSRRYLYRSHTSGARSSCCCCCSSSSRCCRRRSAAAAVAAVSATLPPPPLLSFAAAAGSLRPVPEGAPRSPSGLISVHGLEDNYIVCGHVVSRTCGVHTPSRRRRERHP